MLVRLLQRQRAFSSLSSYPSRPLNRTTIPDFISQYSHKITPGERLVHTDPNIVLCGRIVSKIRKFARDSLVFLHIESDGSQVQVLSDESISHHVFDSTLQRGDIIQVKGFPGKTKTGELSLLVTERPVLLSRCLRDLNFGRGDGESQLSDVSFLTKHREVQLILQGEPARAVFRHRASILRAIRSFLDTRDFLEVETPILSPTASGAFAKPFVTKSSGDGGKTLTLRIAPELALKRLLVGGLPKVYEMGKVFRDEGLSPRHNPEFTSLELYESFANAEDFHLLAKRLLQACFDAVYPQVALQSQRRITPGGIDFDAEFPVVSISRELERFGLFTFADESSVTCDKLLSVLDAKTKSSLLPSELRSVPKLLDKLIGQEIERKLDPKIPTLLVDHPTLLSPLAREKSPGVVERFELFAGSFELCNAYSELNDPKEQRHRFMLQLGFRDSGDEECTLPDEGFCQALEYGLPPCAGFGMGVDRLVMTLLNLPSIRDVVLFPHTS